MWPQLPIEFVVVGTPVSHQNTTPQSRNAWKDRVRNAALASIPEGSWALANVRLVVSMIYLPTEPMAGDLDNRIKLILDALAPTVILDDTLVDRIVAQRIDPAADATFLEPSDTLIEAMAMNDPTVYIRIAEVSVEDIRI